jgi:hypothetical protein
MSNGLALAALIVVPVGVFVAFFRLPRWCTRSLHRHRIWALRDRVVDDVIDGRLSAEHRAVRDLLRSLDHAAHSCSEMTMLGMYVYQRVMRSNREAARLQRMEQAKARSCAGLPDEQRELVGKYRENLVTLLSGTLLLGSWFGLLHVVAFLPWALIAEVREARRGVRHRIRDTEIWTTGRLATDMAVQRTRLGHQMAKWAEADGVLATT